MHCVAKKLVHPDLKLQEREESKNSKLHNEPNNQKEKDEYHMWLYSTESSTI